MAVANNLYDPSKPVFALKSGKNFTKKAFNKGLELLLSDFCDTNHKITGHSFRAAIPTLISSISDKCTVSELKEWGNWESSSFKVYEKTKERKSVCFLRKLSRICMHVQCTMNKILTILVLF